MAAKKLLYNGGSNCYKAKYSTLFQYYKFSLQLNYSSIKNINSFFSFFLPDKLINFKFVFCHLVEP